MVDDPLAAGTGGLFTVWFTDVDTTDTHTAVWSWGDGTPDEEGMIDEVEGTVSDYHIFLEAGIYTVSVEVTDSTDLTAQVSREVVVYDPTAGFVTGSGWIHSPPGAYKPDESLVGRATFGFVSKYKKGATEPTGNTEFQFHAARLNFHSNDYDWLVIAGARAQYNGSSGKKHSNPVL